MERRWGIGGLAGLTTLVAMLQASTALAQDVGQAPAAAAASEDIIVTAQRRAEALERTPVAVTVLNAESLTRQVIVSENDLQRAVPGLIVKAGQTANQLNFSLRGQTVDSFSSSRPAVLPYINEVQIGGASATAFYDLQSIQVLKGPQGTLFGRNSTGGAVLITTAKPTNELEGYVSGRVGNYNHYQLEGAINVPLVDDTVLLRVAGFLQRQDGFQFNRFTNSRLGDIERDSVRGSLTLKPTERLTNELVIDYLRTGGSNISSVVYNVLPLGQGNPFVPNNLLYSPAVDAAFGPGAWAAFLAVHPQADPDGIIAFADKQRERGPFDIDTDSPNFHWSRRTFISNITTLELGENSSLRSILGYNHRRGNDTSEFDGTPFPANTNGPEGRGGSLRQFSAEAQIVGKAFDRQLDYVAGIYYSDETDDSRSITVLLDLRPAAPPIRQVNDVKTENETIAGYAQGTLDLSQIVGLEGLGFTVGGRYSSEKVTQTHQNDDAYVTAPNPLFVNPRSETFNKFSWTLGLQYQASDDLLLYLASRRSFRSGGFNFFAPPIPGIGNEGGGGYAPETATDIEFGAKYSGIVGSVPVRANFAAYNMWIDDIQRSDYVAILGNLAGITVNVPKAVVSGFELDGVVNPVSWLSLGGNLNYTNARFTDNLVSVIGNPPVAFGPYPDTPEWSGTVFADATVPISNNLDVSFRADLYAQTSFFFSSTNNTLNPGTSVPGYALVNFRLGLADEGRGWSLALNLRNAFDRTYYVGGIGFSSLLALNTVIPGEPRTWLLEARYRF